jgi:hypothetical protein
MCSLDMDETKPPPPMHGSLCCSFECWPERRRFSSFSSRRPLRAPAAAAGRPRRPHRETTTTREGDLSGPALSFFIALTPFPNGVPTFGCVVANRLVIIVGHDVQRVLILITCVSYYHLGVALFVSVVAVAAAVVAAGQRDDDEHDDTTATLWLDPAIALYLVLADLCALVCSSNLPLPTRRRTSTLCSDDEKSWDEAW